MTKLFAILSTLAALYCFSASAANTKWSIDLYRSPESGFYTNVDLTIEKNKKFDKNIGIILSHSNFLVFGNPNCFSSETFQCLVSDSGCYVTEKRKDNFVTPFYNVSGPVVNLKNAAFEHWKFGGEAIMVESIMTPTPLIRYQKLHGVLGFAPEIFKDKSDAPEVFSVHINRLENGKIYSYEDPAFGKEKSPIVQFQAKGNWQIDCNGMLVNDFNLQINNDVLYFDFNQETIMLPFIIYTTLQNHLSKFGVSCSRAMLDKPLCEYNGDINLLPNLTFTAANQKLILPPQLYVNNTEIIEGQSYIRLLLSSISNEKGKGRLTSNQLLGIYLGEPFFNYYYTVFNTKTLTVSLYTAKSKTPVDESGSSFFLYVVVVLFIIIAASYFVITKRKNRAKSVKQEEEIFIQKVPTDNVYIPDHDVPDLARSVTSHFFKKEYK